MKKLAWIAVILSIVGAVFLGLGIAAGGLEAANSIDGIQIGNSSSTKMVHQDKIIDKDFHTIKVNAGDMDRGCKETGVKRIRIHDLRHSHVSLLIEMGFTAVDIANRVGHESVKITYRYAHMFPSKDEAIAKKLADIRGGTFDEQKKS